MGSSVFISRVVLANYKSIKECSVRLGPLTFLVGPNGSGKSNFLDALRLVAEALNTSLEHALRQRGGINEVRRRSSGHPTHFGIRLEWKLPEGTVGRYAFRVGAKKGGFEVQKEECHIFEGNEEKEFYRVENGVLAQAGFTVAPPASPDRLYLVAAAGLPAFRPLYDALSHMGSYNLNPDEIRELQPPDPGGVLRRDGGNLASVLDSLSRMEVPAARDRIVSMLSKVVPGIQDVDFKPMGKKGTLEFRQRIGGSKEPWRFMAENMSDGTLRALGVLTALFQSYGEENRRVPFVGIEEPEVALHPGAAGILRDALRAASDYTQVAVTSHSPDLLDDKDIADDCILVVSNREGDTSIGPMDEAGKSAIRDRLYTAGELLRMDQIEPDESAISRIPPKQLDLFADVKE